MRDPLGFLRGARARHGDVVEVSLGPLDAILLSRPEMVEDVLVTRNRLWRKDAYMRQSLRPVLGEGLLSSEGDFWRRQRRLAQPSFHRERVAAYGAIMVERASVLASRWRDGEVRDVHEDMMRLTLEIVAEALFGTNVGDRAKDVGEAVKAILAFVSDPLQLFLPFTQRFGPRRRKFTQAIEKLDAILYDVIERRRRTGETRNDLLSMLLEARDEDGSRMSDRQLRDECMTLFLAGHETTAIALSWTWLLLARNPRVRADVEAEIESVLGDRAPTVEDVPKLRKIGNVVTESLRLYPPAWSVGREALEDLELAGYEIRRGENVWFCPWAIQRDARWFDDPDAFRPERWEGDLAKRLPRYAYFPFGGGPRLCIGQSFALIEIILVLATLGRSFRVEPQKTPTPAPSVTLRPKNGLPARIHALRPGSVRS